MEEGEASTKLSAVTSTISRLERQISMERQSHIKAKMEANSNRLRMFSTHLLALSSTRAARNSSLLEKDMLNIRVQRALHKLATDGSSDQSQDDSVVFNPGGKGAVKPVKLHAVAKIPPYTTWIFLDKNQRMAEDQSLVGRRRIYYDSAANETLICSDSEEEPVDEKEEKREFSKGDDLVISTTIQEHGFCKAVLKMLAESLEAKTHEIEARYEQLVKEPDTVTSPDEDKPNLAVAMKSCDNLFCRRCLVFCCRLHGCSQPVVVPSEKPPPLNNTAQPPPEPCGPSCFYSLSGDQDGVDARLVISPAAFDVQENTSSERVMDVGLVSDMPVPKVSERKKGVDKSVNVLRKLLKRKARSTEEDGNECRKRHQTSQSAEMKPEGEQSGASVYLRKLLSKVQRRWKGNNIIKARRPTLLLKACSDDGVQSVCKAGNWSKMERDLYEKGLEIFGRDSCAVARNMLKGMKTCAEIGQLIQLETAANRILSEETKLQQDGSRKTNMDENMDMRPRLYNGRRRGRVRRLKYTWKSVGYPKKIIDGNGRRQYTPCSCPQTCGKQCSCLKNGTFCEKYCGCPKSCKNRFRGCHCAKSQCSSRQCPCFAAGRECDPDVCRNCWIGCGVESQVGTSTHSESYKCRNMKLLLKQQQRILLAKSDVVGWGAFLKNPVNKHEYLGEYTGELISHREADWRGKIYDREDSSFLFNLNDQYVLDACRKGDKLKFANHSPNPNCYAKVIMVAGDHRVGIYSKERISAGEELFYDYCYAPDSTPAWARKPESHKHDASASGSGPAQKTA